MRFEVKHGRVSCIRACWTEYSRIAEKKDKYNEFYEQLGKFLNLGVHQDSTNKTNVAELLQLHTYKFGDKQIGLKEYVNHMKEG